MIINVNLLYGSTNDYELVWLLFADCYKFTAWVDDAPSSTAPKHVPDPHTFCAL